MSQDEAMEDRDPRYRFESALDGELPPERVEQMLRHAADCPECAEEWERARRLKELVRRSCADRAPSELRERIAVQCRDVTVTRTESVTRTRADGSTVRMTRTSTSTRRSYPAP